METTTKIIQAKEGEVNKYITDCQTADVEIKNLKEKLKGNISLIQAKDIISNDIIGEMKAIWGFLTIVAEERSIIRDFCVEEKVEVAYRRAIYGSQGGRNGKREREHSLADRLVS